MEDLHQKAPRRDPLEVKRMASAPSKRQKASGRDRAAQQVIQTETRGSATQWHTQNNQQVPSSNLQRRMRHSSDTPDLVQQTASASLAQLVQQRSNLNIEPLDRSNSESYGNHNRERRTNHHPKQTQSTKQQQAFQNFTDQHSRKLSSIQNQNPNVVTGSSTKFPVHNNFMSGSNSAILIGESAVQMENTRESSLEPPIGGVRVVIPGQQPTPHVMLTQFSTPSNCYTQMPQYNNREAREASQNRESTIAQEQSYDMTAPLHTPSIINRNMSVPTSVSRLNNQQQHNFTQNIHHHTHSSVYDQNTNVTLQTQAAHPNLQAIQAQMLNQHPTHLSASQFDMSTLLKGQQSLPQIDIHEFGSVSQRNISQPNVTTGAQSAFLRAANEAASRDLDFLRMQFINDVGCETNDILTLFSFWQSNFGAPGSMMLGNQTQQGIRTNANSVTGGVHRTRIQQQQNTLVNFNSQSFDNKTMTASQLQPKMATKFIGDFALNGDNEYELYQLNHSSVEEEPQKTGHEVKSGGEQIDGKENEFSFEEPAIAPTDDSIEEEEKSLINALSFTKIVQEEIVKNKKVPKAKPLLEPSDRHGSVDMPLQLSPIDRKRMQFHRPKLSMLQAGIKFAKNFIKMRGVPKRLSFTQKQAQFVARKLRSVRASFLPQQLLAVNCFQLPLSASQEEEQRPQRRRDRSKTNKSSKSRTRKGSRSRKRRTVLTLDSSSEDDISAPGRKSNENDDTQDIEKLCEEIEAFEHHFNEIIDEDQNEFEKHMERGLSQAERALMDSRKESRERSQNSRSAYGRGDLKGQSLASLPHVVPLLNLKAVNPSGGSSRQQAQQQMHTDRPVFTQGLSYRQKRMLDVREGIEEKSTGSLEPTRTQDKPKTSQLMKKHHLGKIGGLAAQIGDQRSETALIKTNARKLNLNHLNQDSSRVKLVTLSSQTQNRVQESEPIRLQLQKANTSSSNNSQQKKITLLKSKNINFNSQATISARGEKPDGHTMKYASARIKLLKVDSNNALKSPMIIGQPSPSSTLGGFSNMRRLVELMINEFYRKKNKSIKMIPIRNQVKTLLDFWQQSLSKERILAKLKNKLSKQNLAEKEKQLMAFLEGTDTRSLLKLGQDSTTRRYGELAVIDCHALKLALEDYLSTQSS